MKSDIDFIFDCACDRRKAIWESSVYGLLQIANLSDDIKSRVISIMQNGKTHEKFAITCHIVYPNVVFDKRFAREILYLALKDKSKKVKEFGAYRANDSNFYDLAQTIKEEADSAVDKSLKEVLKHIYICLTKGYVISGDKKHIFFSFSRDNLPEGIPEENIHDYVVERYSKVYDRISDLYGSG